MQQQNKQKTGTDLNVFITYFWLPEQTLKNDKLTFITLIALTSISFVMWVLTTQDNQKQEVFSQRQLNSNYDF